MEVWMYSYAKFRKVYYWGSAQNKVELTSRINNLLTKDPCGEQYKYDARSNIMTPYSLFVSQQEPCDLNLNGVVLITHELISAIIK